MFRKRSVVGNDLGYRPGFRVVELVSREVSEEFWEGRLVGAGVSLGFGY